MTTTKTTKTTKCIPLSTSWVFYFEEKGTTLLKPPPTLANGRNPLSNSLPSLLNPSCVLGKFDSVQGFWSYWNNINLSTLPPCSQIKLFKSTVLPQPDALTNTNGGKWVIACDKSQNISQFWLLCLLALIGEQFQDDYIVGSVLSVGARNTISIWTREHHRKCMESTEKDLCRLLNISREKMRFQKHNKEAKPVKCFKIKVSRSVDLTHSPESPSSSPNNPASYSPNISPSPSDDDLTVFIDLKTGTTQKGTKSQPQRITTLTPRPHKSPQVLPTARMAVSIDSANFQKWRGNEYLPKLHRRRGRRSSWYTKLPIISYSQTLIPQISQNNIPENNDKLINTINVVSADEKDISAVLLQSTTTKKKYPLNNNTQTLEKIQLVNSSGFIGGFSYLAWISIFLGLTTVLLGTYVTLFLPAGI